MFSFIFQVVHLNKAPTIPHSTVDHIQEEKKTGEELLVFAILRYIYVYCICMYTRQWRRKSLYQKLLFAWLRTFWQMLLHFYDRIVTQVMYKNMYITTLLLPAIQLAFEKCSVFLIEIRNLAIWWLRYHPKLYIPSTFETQMNLVPFCWHDLYIRAVCRWFTYQNV